MTSRSLASTTLPTATVAALSRAGYDNLQDLLELPAQELANQIHYSLPASQAILENAKVNTHRTQISSQPVANLVSSRQKYASCYPPINVILNGGLSPGQILEISGPPGSPKEIALLGFVSEAVKNGSKVLFVAQDHVLYSTVQDEVQMISFLHGLPAIISSSQIQMLVFSNLSFALQNLPLSSKTHVLETIRHALLRLCASMQIVVIISSQLAIKLYNLDGSAGNFDTGSRGILAPTLGLNYLPKGRSYRLTIVPLSKTSGYITLLSSPVNATIGEGEIREPYFSENGTLK